MNVLKIVGGRIQIYRIRQRFPGSVIHDCARVDSCSILGRNSVLFSGAVLMNSRLGEFSYVQSGTTICDAEIGPYCSIAGGSYIGLAAHPTTFVSTSPIFYDPGQPLPMFFTRERFAANVARTVIGADVWIGHGAMIKAGIQIGTGAVIGAGAVVTKNVAPYIIAAGNPCRPIKERFPTTIVQRLIRSEWWNLSTKELQDLAPLFCNPEEMLLKVENARGD